MNTNYLVNLKNYSLIKWVSIVSLCFALLFTAAPNAQAQNAPAETNSRPAIVIEHLAVNSHVLPGAAAEFTVVVTNTGNVQLENVTVSSRDASDCARSIGGLAPNQVYSYTCELAEIYTSTTSRLTVVGAPVNNPLVVNTAEAVVEIMSPVLAIIKNPTQGQTRAGERIVMTYNYENSGAGDAVGVQLVETVPEGTHFLPEASDDGWACENGNVEAGTVCFYTIDLIEAGESATGQFPFIVLQEADEENSENNVNSSGAAVAAPSQLPLSLFIPFVTN